MGRTRQTYRDQLSRLEGDWQAYRQALRDADQATFDRLFDYAQAHAAASGQQNPIAPFQTAVFSMLVEIESERQALERQVEALEDALETQ